MTVVLLALLMTGNFLGLSVLSFLSFFSAGWLMSNFIRIHYLSLHLVHLKPDFLKGWDPLTTIFDNLNNQLHINL
jgi:hypothetical protein